jgi:hypothetical protein
MTQGSNQYMTYGPLALERHVKGDGRKLLIYTLHPGEKGSASSASASASAGSASPNASASSASPSA